ncbi:thioesterase family protein [Chitinispirillales bacterium ANBcel5]|uniref:acyl-CoA thioesterase n=1 Tax=Cellulosispirillum alkaliphilum TaxID=3039283 RepID=UPI002A56E453|nr:thioesterase family protein [Chitinispirillales bacterium ANBcel5]
MNNYAFTMQLSVRDYECDLQGIVNNSVYQNYLEHVRHEYIKSIGINFKDYAMKGINFVVLRVELDYKFPLSSGDTFWVGINMYKASELKIGFQQDIFRLNDNKPVLKGKVLATALNTRGRPEIPSEVKEYFEA